MSAGGSLGPWPGVLGKCQLRGLCDPGPPASAVLLGLGGHRGASIDGKRQRGTRACWGRPCCARGRHGSSVAAHICRARLGWHPPKIDLPQLALNAKVGVCASTHGGWEMGAMPQVPALGAWRIGAQAAASGLLCASVSPQCNEGGKGTLGVEQVTLRPGRGPRVGLGSRVPCVPSCLPWCLV